MAPEVTRAGLGVDDEVDGGGIARTVGAVAVRPAGAV